MIDIGRSLFVITVPKLTALEFKKLESQLPLEAGAELELGTIPPGEEKNFQTLYRYLPSFAVLESWRLPSAR